MVPMIGPAAVPNPSKIDPPERTFPTPSMTPTTAVSASPNLPSIFTGFWNPVAPNPLANPFNPASGPAPLAAPAAAVAPLVTVAAFPRSPLANETILTGRPFARLAPFAAKSFTPGSEPGFTPGSEPGFILRSASPKSNKVVSKNRRMLPRMAGSREGKAFRPAPKLLMATINALKTLPNLPKPFVQSEPKFFIEDPILPRNDLEPMAKSSMPTKNAM